MAAIFANIELFFKPFQRDYFLPLIMYVDKFLTKKVKSWIMKKGSREKLIPPLQIKAVVFNISCTHRQKRQKVHYSFVDGVYLSSFIEHL